jgi:hypothetical protein
MHESKEWEKTGIAYPMAGSIMEYVWYVHTVCMTNNTTREIRLYWLKSLNRFCYRSWMLGLVSFYHTVWQMCLYCMARLSITIRTVALSPSSVSFSRVSFVGGLPSEQNNFVRRASMPSWKFSTFDLYFDIDIRSEANIVGPNSLSPCDISNHHGRGRTSERELQKTLIALSLENINGGKKTRQSV